MQEAWRGYVHAFLAPGRGRSWRSEPADKLDTHGLRLDFPALFASDITGRARAFAAMVQAGMDVSGRRRCPACSLGSDAPRA